VGGGKATTGQSERESFFFKEKRQIGINTAQTTDLGPILRKTKTRSAPEKTRKSANFGWNRVGLLTGGEGQEEGHRYANWLLNRKQLGRGGGRSRLAAIELRRRPNLIGPQRRPSLRSQRPRLRQRRRSPPKEDTLFRGLGEGPHSHDGGHTARDRFGLLRGVPRWMAAQVTRFGCQESDIRRVLVHRWDPYQKAGLVHKN